MTPLDSWIDPEAESWLRQLAPRPRSTEEEQPAEEDVGFLLEPEESAAGGQPVILHDEAVAPEVRDRMRERLQRIRERAEEDGLLPAPPAALEPAKEESLPGRDRPDGSSPPRPEAVDPPRVPPILPPAPPAKPPPSAAPVPAGRDERREEKSSLPSGGGGESGRQPAPVLPVPASTQLPKLPKITAPPRPLAPPGRHGLAFPKVPPPPGPSPVGPGFPPAKPPSLPGGVEKSTTGKGAGSVQVPPPTSSAGKTASGPALKPGPLPPKPAAAPEPGAALPDSGGGFSAPEGPLAERLGAYRRWLTRACGWDQPVVFDRHGCPLHDSEGLGTFIAAAVSLGVAWREACALTDPPGSLRAVHSPWGERTMTVLPVPTRYGDIYVAGLVDAAIGQDLAARVARALREAAGVF